MSLTNTDLLRLAEEVLTALVEAPVEPRGILSRIETILTQVRDAQLEIGNHMQDLLMGMGERLEAMDKRQLLTAQREAETDARRDQVLRQYLVQLDSRMSAIETKVAMIEAKLETET